MTGFGDIIGHEQIIEHFRSALKNHQVSHAYILNGENGSGKNMLAKAFAKALVCEAGYGDSCNMCRACHQFDSGNHPDVKWITHEKANSIGVDEVREQINNDIVIKPYSSKYKVYIIDEAEKMTVQAQNALLKTIEEPPEYAVILFLTNTLDVLLQMYYYESEKRGYEADPAVSDAEVSAAGLSGQSMCSLCAGQCR